MGGGALARGARRGGADSLRDASASEAVGLRRWRARSRGRHCLVLVDDMGWRRRRHARRCTRPWSRSRRPASSSSFCAVDVHAVALDALTGRYNIRSGMQDSGAFGRAARRALDEKSSRRSCSRRATRPSRSASAPPCTRRPTCAAGFDTTTAFTRAAARTPATSPSADLHGAQRDGGGVAGVQPLGERRSRRTTTADALDAPVLGQAVSTWPSMTPRTTTNPSLSISYQAVHPHRGAPAQHSSSSSSSSARSVLSLALVPVSPGL